MHRRIPQGVKVASSIIALFLFLIALVAFDSWMFRENTLASPKVTNLAAQKERTAQAYEIYNQWRLSHLQQAYTWQARSTKIMFWLSMLIAVSGVGFSFWQFVASAKEAEKASQENEIEVKGQLISLSLKSRSIAALVLFVSMAYLTLYALLIYPIKPTADTAPSPTSQGAPIPKSVIDQADNNPPEAPK